MIDKFKEKFVEEAQDNVRDLEESLLLLEEDLNNMDIIERIFRAMHSLKGGGAMFGFNDLSDFTHHLETIFDLIRNNQLKANPEIISLTFKSIDHIKELLEKGNLESQDDIDEQNEIIKEIEKFVNINDKDTNEPELKEDESKVTDDESKTYLISVIPNEDILKNGTNPLFLLDDLHAMGNAVTISFTKNIPLIEEFEPIKNYCSWQVVLNTVESDNEIKDVFIFVEDECTIEITEIANGNVLNNPMLKKLIEEAEATQEFIKKEAVQELNFEKNKTTSKAGLKKKNLFKEHKISSIRVASNKIDDLVNLVSEMVTIQAQLNLYAENSGDPAIISLAENIQKLSRQLRDNAFEISLIPLQNELMRFQRLVRDLSKEMNKEIDFIVEGGEIELDKNIIENLTDPLLHIIRNSVDHGIELPEERIKLGKSPKGTILFRAYYSGANVIIKIQDDGRGIDTDVIRKKAIEKGLIDKDIELTKKEILDLVFLSGFTTRNEVSDISGRGVGMDVVKRKINDIRGEVSIESELGQGTIITLELPLTLSIIDGLLVEVVGKQYVIPISSIEKIYSVSDIELGKSFNKIAVIDNEQYSYIDLRDVFEEESIENNDSQLILVKYEDRRVGLIVDNVIGEYQTVVKSLGRFLKTQENISGASIMGDGSISLVIDTNRLIQYNASHKYKTKK
ncbi:MAG: chemotaxis protein CheA [Chlorobi bacterium]|nr:chemotaxis protein CheA [Chlorobiota bacterium]